jgi:Family of unknown function (DUF6931)
MIQGEAGKQDSFKRWSLNSWQEIINFPMSKPELALIDAKTAAEVCTRAPLSDEARSLLGKEMTPRAYLDLLREKKHHLDGIRFLAHAMVKRAVVWWTCLCATETLGPEAPEAATKALETARAWVVDPGDENRRACWPAAEAAEIGTPAGCAAMAAFVSGGSLAPADLPAVPPGEDLTARLAIGALVLAAVMRQPEKAAEKYASFLQLGCAIAEGKNPWPSPPRVPPSRPALKKK